MLQQPRDWCVSELYGLWLGLNRPRSWHIRCLHSQRTRAEGKLLFLYFLYPFPSRDIDKDDRDRQTRTENEKDIQGDSDPTRDIKKQSERYRERYIYSERDRDREKEGASRQEKQTKKPQPQSTTNKFVKFLESQPLSVSVKVHSIFISSLTRNYAFIELWFSHVNAG